MTIFFFKFLVQYISFIPNNIIQFFLLRKNKLLISKNFFDIIQYRSDHTGHYLISFFIPLIINVSQISNDVLKIIQRKKVVSIVSLVIFYEEGSNNQYTHSLAGNNKLYSMDNFNSWSKEVLFSLIEKLELYKSFRKISFIVRVKEITNI